MRKRVSIAVCLTLGVSFIIGVGCGSIPDNRKIQPPGYSGTTDAGSGGAGGVGGATGSTGGKSGTGGQTGSTGGGPGAGGGGTAAGGSASIEGGLGTGGGVVSTEAGAAEGGGPVGISCGTNVCPDRQVGGATLTACCAGASGKLCGLLTGVLGTTKCVPVNQPGTLDSNCDPFTIPNTSTELSGCCQPNGSCGLVVEPPGGPHFGCIDASEAGASTKSCTPPASCKAAGKNCAADSECCSQKSGLPNCFTFSGTQGKCTEYCVTNGDCASGCCFQLVNGRGVCDLDGSFCDAGCQKRGDSCDIDADCCPGTVCATNSEIGPRLCRPLCTTDNDCGKERCVKDAAGRGTCSQSGSSLCTDTCNDPVSSSVANNGYCEDGGPGANYHDCALGTDCTDCGVRLGGFSLCDDSCANDTAGVCEDGGRGSTKASCSIGSDCTDCGPRLGLCSNDCQYPSDGVCDDGGPGSTGSYCAYGTDCIDCGARFGGRGQAPCDGTVATRCTPNGGILEGDIGDTSCQCADCAWDAGKQDCAVTTTKCDGQSISACCAPGNPCNLADDGLCECGGWCMWEKDCGPGASGARCDGVSVPYNAADCKYPTGTNASSSCDCLGACSWEAAQCTTQGTCKDTCLPATRINNGICEDGAVGSASNACARGTDCADCGAR